MIRTLSDVCNWCMVNLEQQQFIWTHTWTQNISKRFVYKCNVKVYNKLLESNVFYTFRFTKDVDESMLTLFKLTWL